LLLVQSPARAAVRACDWKLLRLAGQGTGKAKNKAKAGNPENPVQLYNLRQDAGETTNLAEQHPDKVAQLQTLLDNWMKNAVPSPAPAE
ncbi:MAG: arylsulfatase, partial [Planctomycetaceae bacterium]